MDKYQKAQKLLDEGGVFYKGKKNNQLYFIVKGKREKFYEVTRDGRGKPKYLCNCKYYLPDDCSHRLACQLYVCKHKLLED